MGPRKISRRAIAYHEAGHVVIARHCQFEVIQASVVTEANSGGRVLWSPPIPPHGYTAPEATEWQRPTYERHIMTLQAGRIAQKKGAPRSVQSFHSQSDDILINRLASRAHRNHEVSLRFVDYLESRTRYLVDRNWVTIERVMLALLDRAQLTREQLQELFGNE